MEEMALSKPEMRTLLRDMGIVMKPEEIRCVRYLHSSIRCIHGK